MLNTTERRRRQQGAALVEGLIVGICLGTILACLFVVHRFSSAHLAALGDARQTAWQSAMNGCGNDNNTGTTGLAEQIVEGALPFLDAIPTLLTEARTFQVTGGPFSPSGRREMKFICNPKPEKTRPLTDMVGWLGDMFT